MHYNSIHAQLTDTVCPNFIVQNNKNNKNKKPHLFWFLDTKVQVHSAGQLEYATDGWKCYISVSLCR